MPRSRSQRRHDMNAPNELKLPAVSMEARPASFLEQWTSYWIDAAQRSVLFLDVLREHANNMLEHERKGLPPLLDFDYEFLLDARTFERPANYALLCILGAHGERMEDCLDPAKPPVIVLDPRAGHGPGIGGFKRDSEVGIALHAGHPVYFVVFFPKPCEGQTLEDVLKALRRFVEEVARRHSGRAPVAYGNCQAGWALALLSADCEGLIGPAVLNGSPLSYWAGESDVNPMRLGGGLAGGAWLARFMADVGAGEFDGAWLVQNFEGLNPAHSLWKKYYDVYAKIDTERERFLDFERWWAGYYFLGREEIVAMVENLFIGNKLERGELRLCHGCTVDLARIRNALVIFASRGDNIAPPHQALAWLPAVYADTAALKAAGQRIVYLLNNKVGHLGIFVSAKVVRFEHRAILESLYDIERLEPGLYEMRIDNPTGDPDCKKPQYSVTFVPRQVSDIRYEYPKHRFERARAVSEANEKLYREYLSPWVQAAATPWLAEFAKWAHPMRASRWMWSETFMPWMNWVAFAAPVVRQNRMPAGEDNLFREMERGVAEVVTAGLDAGRRTRDAAQESAFAALYD